MHVRTLDDETSWATVAVMKYRSKNSFSHCERFAANNPPGIAKIQTKKLSFSRSRFLPLLLNGVVNDFADPQPELVPNLDGFPCRDRMPPSLERERLVAVGIKRQHRSGDEIQNSLQ